MIAILEPRRLVAVLLALVVAACGLLVTRPPSARAADPAAAGPSRVSVRGALAAAGSADVALVDQVTPRPSVDGKRLLCVDGAFYARAARDIQENVKEKARRGTPVVFVGGDIDDLTLQLGGPLEEAAVAAAEPRTQFAALRLTPGAGGQPAFNGFRLMGDGRDLRSALAGVRNWVKDMDRPKPVEADPNWYQRAYFRLYSDDALKPYGKTCVDRYYYRLSNDGNATYDYVSVEIRFEQMSGQSAYTENWKNEWAYQYCNVKQYQPNNSLLRYGPTSTVGQVSTSYSLGVTATEKGAGVSATYSQAYSQPDVTCTNSSDLGGGITRHKWSIGKSSITATSTFAAESSGFTYQHTAGEGLAAHYECFQSQWKQYHWYGDKWFRTTWARSVSNI